MFHSKYIFETKKTRTLRRFKTIFFIFLGFSLFYLISGYLFLLAGQREGQKAEEAFFQSGPDLIVVFTGAAGRISYAIEQAKKFKQSHIFITGVYSKNSVDTLINPLKVKHDLDLNLLKIDYLARNTLENVISTIRILRQSQEFKRILIISHDYHILRIKTIINQLIDQSENYQFYYQGVKSDYRQIKNWRILYKEVYKWLSTFALLMIWEG